MAAMNRRAFGGSLAALLLARGAHGRDARRPRIGFVANTIPVSDLVARTSTHPAPRIVEGGLRERGWVDGHNLDIIWRSAEGRYDRLTAIFEELARMPVDVLVAFGTSDIAVRVTRTIPIVMTTGAAPIEDRVGPGPRQEGNVTGIGGLDTASLNAKRLGLLKEVLPGITRVGFFVLGARTRPELASFSRETRDAARRLGLELFHVGFEAGNLGPAFEAALQARADAMVMPDWAELHWPRNQQAVHEHANRHRLPVMHMWLSAALSGGLMAYGIDDVEVYGRMPHFIDRILRGAKPSELPIEQPVAIRLIVNLAAARRIGLSFPASILIAAHRLVE